MAETGREFRVRYEIDVTAENPVQAAQLAWDMATDPASFLPVLTVSEPGVSGSREVDIDLDEVAREQDG